LSADDLPYYGTLNRADKSANYSADRNHNLPTGAGMRSIRQLPMATGMSVEKRFNR
jgi:hypothetical protein